MFKKIKDALLTNPSIEADIDPALTLDQDTSYRWDLSADIVIAGCGGAGISAGLEAHEAGADVLMLDRYNAGGATKISGGIFYAGGGTEIQKKCGVEDSAENMYNYLKHEVKDAVSDETLRDFCESSLDNYDFITRNGVEFHPSQCPFKTAYPPNNYYYYYSGNESFPPYSDSATPAARGHRAYVKGVSGAGIFNPLLKTAQDKKLKLRTQTNVKRLVQDHCGRVIGLEAKMIKSNSLAAWLHQKIYGLLDALRYTAMYMPMVTRFILFLLNTIETHCAKSVNIRANKAVILATGGHYFNKPLVQEHAPKYVDGMPLGTIGDDGSGLRLGQSIGADTKLIDSITAWRFTNPPEAFIKGILVNAKGERICNEMLYGAQVAEQMIEHHGGKGYLIIDQTLFNTAKTQLGPKHSMWFQAASALMYLYIERKKGKTLTELAKKMGMPTDTLLNTVTQYNENGLSDEVDPMGKPKTHFSSIENGPFYALNCSFDSKIVPCPTLSLGGLRVDEKTGQVINTQGDTVAGLYAAGRSAAGVASRSYVSGLSIADCVYSGRRAAKHIIQTS